MAKKKKSKVTSKNSRKSKKMKEIIAQEAKDRKKFTTYTKAILTFVIINSELQIWASYGLAYLGREAIAESLSEQVVIVVIGSLIPYFAKSLIENLSKRTTLFGKNLPYENSETFNVETIVEDFQREVEEVKEAGINPDENDIDLNSIDEEVEVNG